jgi:hypothetical protein
MKIGLSFVTLASSAMLVLLSVSPAEAHTGKSGALWVPVGASHSSKHSQALTKRLQTHHVTIRQQEQTTNGIQPTSPWYAYDAALRAAEHQKQQQTVSGIQPTSPWYAYDAALRAAERQKQQQTVSGIQPTSPWYAYDAAVRAAEHQRQEQLAS